MTPISEEILILDDARYQRIVYPSRTTWYVWVQTYKGEHWRLIGTVGEHEAADELEGRYTPKTTFPLGRCVMTQGVAHMVSDGMLNPLALLSRHARGDWGTVCKDDWAANDEALKEGSLCIPAKSSTHSSEAVHPSLPNDTRLFLKTRWTTYLRHSPLSCKFA